MKVIRHEAVAERDDVASIVGSIWVGVFDDVPEEFEEHLIVKVIEENKLFVVSAIENVIVTVFCVDFVDSGRGHVLRVIPLVVPVKGITLSTLATKIPNWLVGG